ncbi:MAG: aldose 1-epimerase family protein [Candidatus Dormibacteria bacterium]
MHPSGDQVEISRGDHRAVVVSVGGGLREYVVAGRPVLDGYDVSQICDGGRGQLLVPWPNRLRDGSYEWADRRLQLPLNEPDRGNAIHGLARWMPWQVLERAASSARLGLDLPATPGYPFQLRLEAEYVLEEGGLLVRQAATNIGAVACPYGAGAHPYLTAGSDLVDACVLEVPARTLLVADERGIPAGTKAVDETEYDFRRPRPIGAAHLDVAYTDLQRGGDGVAWATLQGSDRHVRLWVDAAHSYLMVFTGDTLAADRRRRGLAIEPMTCAPNAFQSGEGLRVLQPRETFVSRWGIAVSD